MTCPERNQTNYSLPPGQAKVQDSVGSGAVPWIACHPIQLQPVILSLTTMLRVKQILATRLPLAFLTFQKRHFALLERF
jgi:hypothetical protein